MQSVSNKVGQFLENTINLNNLESKDLIHKVLNTLHSLLENCPSAMIEKATDFAKVLMKLHNIKDFSSRFQISKCWLCLLRIRVKLLTENISELFNFFLMNLTQEHYEMNFASAEFINYIIDQDEKEEPKDEIVYEILHNNLHK